MSTIFTDEVRTPSRVDLSTLVPAPRQQVPSRNSLVAVAAEVLHLARRSRRARSRRRALGLPEDTHAWR